MEQWWCLQYQQRPVLYCLGRIRGPVSCATKEGECCHKKSEVCINDLSALHMLAFQRLESNFYKLQKTFVLVRYNWCEHLNQTLDELLTLVKLFTRLAPCEFWDENQTVQVLH